MNCKHYQCAFYLFLLTTLCLAFGATAQKNELKECKARVKANRNKLFRFDAYKVIESEYQIEKSTIRVTHRTALDSVHIYSPDGQLAVALNVQKNGLISSPVRLNYVVNGLRLTDSVVPDGGRRRSNAYFENLLSSNSVLWTADPQAGTMTYYGIGGQDSLSITDLKGQGREIIWYKDGMDSLKKRWNEAGSLEYERTLTSEKIWSAEQQLIQHTFDSLVHDKWPVRCQKNWYPTGILSSVTFHYRDTPCLTWKYYNEQGKLTRMVKHKALKGTPVYSGVGIIPMEERFFPTVYQEDPVNSVFTEVLNYRLAALLCRANVALDGVYTLQVDRTSAGVFIFKSIEGLHAAEIQADLARFFNGLEKVRPAIRNGRPYAQLLELTLKVKPKVK